MTAIIVNKRYLTKAINLVNQNDSLVNIMEVVDFYPYNKDFFVLKIRGHDHKTMEQLRTLTRR